MRHGWAAGKPSVLNLIGVIPVVVGASVFCWSMIVHFTSAPEGWRLEITPHHPTPEYLLTRGPYHYSRNPIYLAEGCIRLGWIVFYGNLAMLAIFAGMSLQECSDATPRSAVCYRCGRGHITVLLEKMSQDIRFGEFPAPHQN